jgi:all-trans-retinol 13,14-reductase
LYVGLDARRVRTPLDGTNLWVHPSLDFDRNLAEFERDLASPFPVVFISFPSANDPSFDTRHPGHAAIEVVTIVGYEPFARWAGTTWHHRGADYDALKQQLADRLLAELRHRVPAIEGAVTTWELSTPLSMQHFTAAAQGASYGLAHSPARFLSRDLRPRTPVGNLFLTGQDIGTCGVMGALSGAVTTASVVVGRNLFNVARTA